MAVRKLRIESQISAHEHLAWMRRTPLFGNRDVRPFDRPGVAVYSKRFRPQALAITSRYVLEGQLRFFITDLFPRLFEIGINPFDMQGSVRLRVEHDTGATSFIPFAAPVCEVLEQPDGTEVVAVTDGMARYTAASLLAERFPDFRLRCTVLDQSALAHRQRFPFYAATTAKSGARWEHAVPPWRERKDYVDERGRRLALSNLPDVETRRVRAAIYARYRVYPGGYTMPRTEGQHFGPGFATQAELGAALDRLHAQMVWCWADTTARRCA